MSIFPNVKKKIVDLWVFRDPGDMQIMFPFVSDSVKLKLLNHLNNFTDLTMRLKKGRNENEEDELISMQMTEMRSALGMNDLYEKVIAYFESRNKK